MSAMMPQLLQQMQNPSVQQLMANPEALQAIMQIQQVLIMFLHIYLFIFYLQKFQRSLPEETKF